MILKHHVPAPPLDRFIECFWYYADWEGAHPMEHVLPEGTFELVINLLDGPRKLFDRGDLGSYSSFRRGWISGAHSRYIIIDTMPGASMIGAHFKAGGAALFLGPSAAAFQDQVVEFEAVWGSAARELRERLLAAPEPAAKFRHLERFLIELVNRSRTDLQRHQRIEWATSQFCQQPHTLMIGAVARQLGISHRHFIDQFRNEVGLTPKLFCRIRRFQEVLRQIQSRRPVRWADVACSCGYYDQPHFVNDFQAFAGLNPSAYRSLGDDYPSFVPIGGSG